MIYERPPKPPTFWNNYTRTLILDTIMKLSGTIGVTQKTMTFDTHVWLILLQTLNPQERWGTHKKRWPFQPRPFADVIGLVRCSYKPFWRCFLVKKGLHLPSNHRLPPAECRFVSCQKCFARHVLQDWEWSKGARHPEKNRKVMGMTRTDIRIVNGMLMDVIFWIRYNLRLVRIVRFPILKMFLLSRLQETWKGNCCGRCHNEHGVHFKRM